MYTYRLAMEASSDEATDATLAMTMRAADRRHQRQPPGETQPPQRLDRTRLTSQTRAFYRRALTALNRAGVPFMVGGACAFAHYTGMERHTKDLDIFTHPQDCQRALDALAADGCRTELTFAHWLGKAFSPDDSGFADIIFSSGNGVARVDDEWFAHAVKAEVMGMRVLVIPLEEMLWSKSFIMERERYDGADIAHLLHAYAMRLDWPRLLRRFGAHWRVLMSYLILFGFVYPEDRQATPQWVMDELLGRLGDEMTHPASLQRVCNGTLLSRQEYLVDIERRGYADGRLVPHGTMAPDEISAWTDAIEKIP
ncbi:MAG: nucleotidyltransferase family protein [Ktedonobacterales bacterium]